MRMYRLLFAVLAALAATQVWVPAHASTVDYTLTFAASSPYTGTGGTGSFELNGPIDTNGNRTYSLTELSMTVDGLSFSLAQDPSAAVSFHNGVFSGLSFNGTDGTGLFTFDSLGTSGTSYDLTQGILGWTLSQGSISAVDPPTATPLPPTVVLFGGALLLLGTFAWMRRAPASGGRLPAIA
jgi:hypothetical protein